MAVTLPPPSTLPTGREFPRTTHRHPAFRAAFQRSWGDLVGSAAGNFDISGPIPKHNRRSPKSGASSCYGVPPREDLNGDSTNHILIHRDRKGDALCHTLPSERKIQ